MGSLSPDWYENRYYLKMRPYLGAQYLVSSKYYSLVGSQLCRSFYRYYNEPYPVARGSPGNSYAMPKWFDAWRKISSIPRASKCPVIVDGVQNDTQPYMSRWRIVDSTYLGTYHRDGANFLFLDSSATWTAGNAFAEINWTSTDFP